MILSPLVEDSSFFFLQVYLREVKSAAPRSFHFLVLVDACFFAFLVRVIRRMAQHWQPAGTDWW